MGAVIRYDELSWPEIAGLPRDVPLVLPLGGGFATEDILSALGAEEFILLPALPYGWEGSTVSVGRDLLDRVVRGIFSGPLEEGFTRPVVAHDGESWLNVEGIRQIALKRGAAGEQAEKLRTSPERVILIPCGHTEQHGYHLPLNTDTVIIDAIARGTVSGAPDHAERMPTLPYGVSMYRSSFAGTLNMGGRTFEDFLLTVIDELVARGADRFYLMSGHGGNCSFLHNVVKYAGDRHHPIFAATTWLHTSGHLGGPALEQYRRSKRGGMGHACELETAYLLHLRPELCRMERVVDEVDFIATPNYFMDWIEGGALTLSAPWEDDTLTGSYGAGSLATAENGACWLEVAVEEKIAHVQEIHEQARRRLARRAEQAVQGIDPMSVLKRQSWSGG